MVNKSLISIIDKWFDKYAEENGEKVTPYSIETNVTLLSFFKQTYKVLKENNYNDLLKQTYINCLEELIANLKFIENSKVYKYQLDINSVNGNLDKAYGLIDCLIYLSKSYTNRNYYKFLDKDEQKIGYEDFYNETIYVSKGLVPTYNEEKEGSVSFELKDNPYMIRLNKNGSFTIFINGIVVELKNSQELKNEIIRMASTGNELLDFYQTCRQVEGQENNTSYFVTFAFEHGFTVDGNNNYEQNNGMLLELLQSAEKSFKEDTNYLELYLKDYFYKVLLEKYRTKEIQDKETNLKTTDISAANFFKALPKKYETLAGKGGNIGGLNSLDFDYNGYRDGKKYVKIPFYNSTYHDNQIDFYIDKNFLTGDLRLLKHFSKIDFDQNDSKSFLTNTYIKEVASNQILNSKYISYFNSKNENGEYGLEEEGKDSNKQAAKFIKYYSKEIKNNILKQLFFAITPKFKPNKDDVFTDNYFKLVPTLQKDFFFDDFEEPRIDIKFTKDDMILSLKTDKHIGSTEIFGTGELTVRKLPQKLYNNTVSEITHSDTVSRNSGFEANEFSSIMDDREFSVVSRSDTMIAQTSYGFTNVMYDDTGSFFIEVDYPSYKKTTIQKKNDEWWLNCTEFSNYVNLEAISQVRVLLMNSNKNRYLFNVDRIEETQSSTTVNTLELNIGEIADLSETSYVIGGTLYIADNIVNINSSLIKEETINVNNGDNEKITYEKTDEDYIISFVSEKEIEGGYINDETVVIDSSARIEDETLIIDGSLTTDEEYKTEKFLVLKPNTVVDKILYENETKCQILDYVSVNGGAKKELGQYIYKSDYDNSYTMFELDFESAFLKIPSFKKNVAIIKKPLLHTLAPKKEFPIALEEKFIVCSKKVSDVSFRVNQIISGINKEIKLKSIRLSNYGFLEHRRPSMKNSVKRISINKLGMVFNNLYKNSGEMIFQFKSDEKFEKLPSTILDCIFNTSDIELDLRSDKFIVFVRKHHLNQRESIGYILSNDAKKMEKNFEPAITSNTLDDAKLMKAQVESFDITQHIEEYTDYPDFPQTTLGFNIKDVENSMVEPARKKATPNNDINSLSVSVSDIAFSMTENKH